VEVGVLAQFERPLPTVGEYDQLLTPVTADVVAGMAR
jgi:hypothetical protein